MRSPDLSFRTCHANLLGPLFENVFWSAGQIAAIHCSFRSPHLFEVAEKLGFAICCLPLESSQSEVWSSNSFPDLYLGLRLGLRSSRVFQNVFILWRCGEVECDFSSLAREIFRSLKCKNIYLHFLQCFFFRRLVIGLWTASANLIAGNIEIWGKTRLCRFMLRSHKFHWISLPCSFRLWKMFDLRLLENFFERPPIASWLFTPHSNALFLLLRNRDFSLSRHSKMLVQFGLQPSSIHWKACYIWNVRSCWMWFFLEQSTRISSRLMTNNEWLLEMPLFTCTLFEVFLEDFWLYCGFLLVIHAAEFGDQKKQAFSV